MLQPDIAHNLGRWTARLGDLAATPRQTIKTLRRRYLTVPAPADPARPPVPLAPAPALALGRSADCRTRPVTRASGPRRLISVILTAHDRRLGNPSPWPRTPTHQEQDQRPPGGPTTSESVDPG
ncbi:protein of unknown function [Blastococcus saxobsidens DD2]|uniref:Uncharacterized protein n=1 Tax=Blastococcus saxobsidens (strain DD2) TaxID=1146883 RepID=H6RL26_BLASD|nr:protein of unknown function [Blastococcus saxobsidens DD2]